MYTDAPQTAFAALTWRRLLLSRWPWRSAGYLFSALPVALVTIAGLAIPAIPWFILLGRLASGSRQLAPVVFLFLLGAALIAAIGPLIAPPLAALERRRLRMVDDRPTKSILRKVALAGPRRSFLARYTDPLTWRELACVVLMTTVAPVMAVAALLLVGSTLVFVGSPFLVLAQQPGDSPVSLIFGDAATVRQTVPYIVTGLILLPVVPYLLTLLAGGQSAITRALLVRGTGAELRAELVEVARSRARLADAFETERRRIERDLHDGAQQRLVSLTLKLGLARLDLPPGTPAAATVADAHHQAKQLMAELRELIHGIQPQVLTDLGLPAALVELADQGPLPVTVDAQLPGRLPSQIENTAYFVAAEALTNAAKHSGATMASIIARQNGNALIVEISDDGRGGADVSGGTGLTGLADRVAVTGGRMLLSSPPGGPTVLRVEVPCDPKPLPSG